ncbi:MAG: winged-helix domain-containing protein, partial [Dehalococcoidia bacterium]
MAEPHRRSEPLSHDEIAEELNEAEDAIRDQLRILDHRGFVFLQTVLDILIPNITPKGLLEAEKLTQAAPQPDPPPISETIPEPQEFDASADYTTVKWQDKEFHFTPLQSHVVRLLHEEFQQGRNDLRDAHVIENVESKVRTLHDLFKRSCGV